MIKVNYWLNLGIICLLASKRSDLFFIFVFRKDKIRFNNVSTSILCQDYE